MYPAAHALELTPSPAPPRHVPGAPVYTCVRACILPAGYINSTPRLQLARSRLSFPCEQWLSRVWGLLAKTVLQVLHPSSRAERALYYPCYKVRHRATSPALAYVYTLLTSYAHCLPYTCPSEISTLWALALALGLGMKFMSGSKAKGLKLHFNFGFLAGRRASSSSSSISKRSIVGMQLPRDGRLCAASESHAAAFLPSKHFFPYFYFYLYPNST